MEKINILLSTKTFATKEKVSSYSLKQGSLKKFVMKKIFLAKNILEKSNLYKSNLNKKVSKERVLEDNVLPVFDLEKNVSLKNNKNVENEILNHKYMKNTNIKNKDYKNEISKHKDEKNLISKDENEKSLIKNFINEKNAMKNYKKNGNAIRKDKNEKKEIAYDQKEENINETTFEQKNMIDKNNEKKLEEGILNQKEVKEIFNQNKKSFKDLKKHEKVAKVLRIATLPPISSAVLFVLLQIFAPSIFLNLWHFFLTLFSISICPVLAYPISYIIPSVRKKGRDGQRNLAIGLSVLGYLFGFCVAILTGAPALEMVIFSTYLMSVLLIVVTYFLFKEKASGHSCSTFGPLCMLCYTFGLFWLFGFVVLGVVFYSSIVLKRHTVRQLFLGALFSGLSFVVSLAIFIL